MYKSVRYCTNMNASDGIAPAVRSILEAARQRPVPDRQPIAVEPRSLRAGIEAAEETGRVPVIAEIKPKSPSSQYDRTDDPVVLAREMVEGGATAISVLTEPEHFGGSTAALSRVREAVDVPVLRKDFILEPAQLDAVEADLVLVIARFVDDLPELVTAARERGFQVLVETHNEAEVEAAVAAGGEIVGINNRDLAALEVDLETFEHVADSVPDDVVLIAESGMETPGDVQRMREAGADAVLIGSAIMRGDVTEQTRSFVGAAQ